MQCVDGCDGRVGLDVLEACDDQELLAVYECCKECMTIAETLYCAKRIQDE